MLLDSMEWERKCAVYFIGSAKIKYQKQLQGQNPFNKVEKNTFYSFPPLFCLPAGRGTGMAGAVSER